MPGAEWLFARSTTSLQDHLIKELSCFARKKKECPFVMEKKGKEFVEDCQVRRQQLEMSFYWLGNFLSWARLRLVLPASTTGPRSWRWSLTNWQRPGSSMIQLIILPTRWFVKISSKVNIHNPSGEVFLLWVSGLGLQAQAPVSLGSPCQVKLYKHIKEHRVRCHFVIWSNALLFAGFAHYFLSDPSPIIVYSYH